MQRHVSHVCNDVLYTVGRTTLSLFSLFRGMSRGKVIRLHRRKQDNISGEQKMGYAHILTYNILYFKYFSHPLLYIPMVPTSFHGKG